MTQHFQAIGQASPDVEHVAAQHNGWPDDQPQPTIDEATSPLNSFWAERANRQALGRSIDNMAGHTETPAAGEPVQPFNPYREER